MVGVAGWGVRAAATETQYLLENTQMPDWRFTYELVPAAVVGLLSVVVPSLPLLIAEAAPELAHHSRDSLWAEFEALLRSSPPVWAVFEQVKQDAFEFMPNNTQFEAAIKLLLQHSPMDRLLAALILDLQRAPAPSKQEFKRLQDAYLLTERMKYQRTHPMLQETFLSHLELASRQFDYFFPGQLLLRIARHQIQSGRLTAAYDLLVENAKLCGPGQRFSTAGKCSCKNPRTEMCPHCARIDVVANFEALQSAIMTRLGRRDKAVELAASAAKKQRDIDNVKGWNFAERLRALALADQGKMEEARAVLLGTIAEAEQSPEARRFAWTHKFSLLPLLLREGTTASVQEARELCHDYKVENGHPTFWRVVHLLLEAETPAALDLLGQIAQREEWPLRLAQLDERQAAWLRSIHSPTVASTALVSTVQDSSNDSGTDSESLGEGKKNDKAGQDLDPATRPQPCLVFSKTPVESPSTASSEKDGQSLQGAEPFVILAGTRYQFRLSGGFLDRNSTWVLEKMPTLLLHSKSSVGEGAQRSMHRAVEIFTSDESRLVAKRNKQPRTFEACLREVRTQSLVVELAGLFNDFVAAALAEAESSDRVRHQRLLEEARTVCVLSASLVSAAGNHVFLEPYMDGRFDKW